MNIELLTEHDLEFLRLIGGCIGSSESTLVKMPHCWKSHVTAHYYLRSGEINFHATFLHVCGCVFIFNIHFCGLVLLPEICLYNKHLIKFHSVCYSIFT